MNNDLKDLRAMLTPAGVRALASAHLDFLESTEGSNPSALRLELARILGEDRVSPPHAPAFEAAARSGLPSPEATLARLQELAVEVIAPDVFEDLERIASERGWTVQGLIVEGVQAVVEGRIRKRPGPPKGRPLKVRSGGEWTPMVLRAELNRLGYSEARFAKLFSVNASTVHKWCTKAIPDDRQEELSQVIAQLSS